MAAGLLGAAAWPTRELWWRGAAAGCGCYPRPTEALQGMVLQWAKGALQKWATEGVVDHAW